ncbi:MAG: DUF4355 domain-containing protein [Clostridia bacterium]|nr:DUF4355 domain-containing protein [Clostridia bacterium]
MAEEIIRTSALMPLCLQRFAGESGDGEEETTGGKPGETAGQGRGESTEKVYTGDEVQKLVQSEADKRVTQALAKQKREYEKKMSLTQLDGQARQDAERDMKIAEYEEQIRTFKLEKNKSDLKAVLATRGLPVELADVIEVGEDAQKIQGRVDVLDKAFRAAVQAEVKSRLTATKPKVGSSEPATITREDFRRMTVSQQAELYAKSPEVYKKLTSGE